LFGSRLYRKYVVYFAALVGAVLLAGSTSDLYSSYYKTRDTTVALHREKAAAAAIRIEQFIHEIEQHVGWTNLLPRGTDSLVLRHIEFIKLLRQAPAVTDAIWLDAQGYEQLRVSRLAIDRLRSGKDFSLTPAFQQARKQTHYRGPVYFREDTEPYMTMAVAAGSGVTLVEVNLKFVWDVINGIHFGKTGHAYVIGANNNLISHPDISLVLKKTDLSSLPQVQRVFTAAGSPEQGWTDSGDGHDLLGNAVLTASARIDPPGWTVFIEQDQREAFAPLYASMLRTGLLVLLGLALALGASALLARRMVRPIRALQEGAARIGAGELDYRIEIHTGDELETLAVEFDRMAVRLRESYSGLEQKVSERTEELVAANRAKSRFLAAASHDLRQPMHALGLFVAQLKDRVRGPESAPLILRVEAAVNALQGLLDALLDVSRLDAGVVTPNVTDFSVNTVLERIENGFAADATNRGLRFRVVRSTLALHSDLMLLERILINLVANAVRYTESGGILVGCRRRGDRVRVEVWDTGIGIASEHQQAIFQEFYQVGNPERDRQKGLGLGLSIAARLARLLGGRIAVRSHPGRGSVFAVELPRADQIHETAAFSTPAAIEDKLRESLVLVVDDDALVCEALGGLLMQWGCTVITATNGKEALAALGRQSRAPDAVLCDYRLPEGETGSEVIRRLRERLGPDLPAALITGDTAPECLREARESGIPLLHKPVQPARLRALLEHLVSNRHERRQASG
jgi:signal transduction histidine kinase/ActR/RegA family two-component response regulator